MEYFKINEELGYIYVATSLVRMVFHLDESSYAPRGGLDNQIHCARKKMMKIWSGQNFFHRVRKRYQTWFFHWEIENEMIFQVFHERQACQRFP